MATRKTAGQGRARGKLVQPPSRTQSADVGPLPHAAEHSPADHPRSAYPNVSRLATLDRPELPPPQSVWDELTWIEIRGTPDYLDPPPAAGAGPPDESFWRYMDGPRRDREANLHIQDVYRRAFEQADLPRQRKVLRSYAANFTELAFDRDGPGAWLWPRWQEWRARRTRFDRGRLSALASGIASQWSTPMTRAWMLAWAKRRYVSLQDELGATYREWAESDRSPDPDVRQAADERLLPDLLAAIKENTDCATSRSELRRKKLSGVLRALVCRRFRVRERDMH